MLDHTPPDALAKSISISELNRQVRTLLEQTLPLLWVRGEISNLTYASSGHLYFSLKDADAQVRCTLWRNKAQLLGFRPENGQQVEARVLVTLYEARGDYQLNVETLRRAGQGDLFQRFLELKEQLAREGLFDSDKRRPLPAFPERIAVVTSPQAAAWRDVLSTFARRAPHVRLTLYPVPVQGEGAARQIAASLAQAAAAAHDLIILCRGGGSLEDLWAFNEEIVARAIRASRLPVITGIGHETDFTIADFAADLRAPTPTAAAEQASPARDALLERLASLAQRLYRSQQRQLERYAQHLDHLAARLPSPARQLQARAERLDDLRWRLRQAMARSQDARERQLMRLASRLTAQRPATSRPKARLEQLALQLQHAWQQARAQRTARLDKAAQALRQLDPHAVLQRGYALVRKPTGKIVRNARELQRGDSLQLILAHGEALASVTQVVTPGEGQ
ncbi:MAG: exodeoxyribonuclease VII large subunit [Azovibrio sp.]|nr:exodeoxyribonuclease VII large subunit [Azovibrio sp.]